MFYLISRVLVKLVQRQYNKFVTHLRSKPDGIIWHKHLLQLINPDDIEGCEWTKYFTSRLPYPSMLTHPPDSSSSEIPCREAYMLQPIFAFVPEFQFPDLFPNGVPSCPTCNSSKDVGSEGWNAEPRRVIMEDTVCNLIGFRYRCKSCEKNNKQDQGGRKITFNAWNKKLLRNYPTTVRLESIQPVKSLQVLMGSNYCGLRKRGLRWSVVGM